MLFYKAVSDFPLCSFYSPLKKKLCTALSQVKIPFSDGGRENKIQKREHNVFSELG